MENYKDKSAFLNNEMFCNTVCNAALQSLTILLDVIAMEGHTWGWKAIVLDSTATGTSPADTCFLLNSVTEHPVVKLTIWIWGSKNVYTLS